MDHVYGGLPPDAVTVTEYGMPIDPWGSSEGEVMTRDWATAISAQKSPMNVKSNSEREEIFRLELSTHRPASSPGIPILHLRILLV
jgi:hypothetical protein